MQVSKLCVYNLGWDASSLYGSGSAPFVPMAHARLVHGARAEAELLGKQMAVRLVSVFREHLLTGLSEKMVVVAAPSPVQDRAAEWLTGYAQRALDVFLAEQQQALTLGAACRVTAWPTDAYERLHAEERAQYWLKAKPSFVPSEVRGQVVVLVDHLRISSAKEAALLEALELAEAEAVVCLYAGASKREIGQAHTEMGMQLRRWGLDGFDAVLKLAQKEDLAPSTWLLRRLAGEYGPTEWQQLAKKASAANLKSWVYYLQKTGLAAQPAFRNLYLVLEAGNTLRVAQKQP